MCLCAGPRHRSQTRTDRGRGGRCRAHKTPPSEMVILLGSARRTARKSRKHHHVTSEHSYDTVSMVLLSKMQLQPAPSGASLPPPRKPGAQHTEEHDWSLPSQPNQGRSADRCVARGRYSCRDRCCPRRPSRSQAGTSSPRASCAAALFQVSEAAKAGAARCTY